MNEIPRRFEQNTLMRIYSGCRWFDGEVPRIHILPPSNILSRYLTSEHSIKIDFNETL